MLALASSLLGTGGRVCRMQEPLRTPVRALHASARVQEVLKLAYEVHEPSGDSSDRPLNDKTQAVVVCHGLYGSKQNWRTVGRAMAKSFRVPVYALDLRNQGDSPHSNSMTYSDMAADVKGFLQDHQLEKVTLMGHSMGGKVSMTLALDPELPPNLLAQLVSVDMSPAVGTISPEFMAYAKAMVDIEEAGCRSRKEADQILQKTESFLLTNLSYDEQKQTWHFRIPVRKIMKALEDIGMFPYQMEVGEKPERTWDGSTLFIKGEQSKYINRHNLPFAKAFFPNMKLVNMPTGHWCQAERPGEFIQHVRSFLESV